MSFVYPITVRQYERSADQVVATADDLRAALFASQMVSGVARSYLDSLRASSWYRLPAMTAA